MLNYEGNRGSYALREIVSTSATIPASDEEIEAFLSQTFASDVETDEKDIDDILYG